MTLVQKARPGTKTDKTTTLSMERVPQEAVQPEGSVGSSDDKDISVYCEDKLRSLSASELQTLVEVSEESSAKILGSLFVSGEIADESMHFDVVGH